MSKDNPTNKEIKAIMLLVKHGWLKIELTEMPLFGKTK